MQFVGPVRTCEAPVGFASPTVETCGCCRCLTTTTSVCYSVVLPFGFIKQTKVFTSNSLRSNELPLQRELVLFLVQGRLGNGWRGEVDVFKAP